MALQLFKIAEVTVASPQANIEFTSIPSGYTDLVLFYSIRSAGSYDNISIRFIITHTMGNICEVDKEQNNSTIR